MQLKRSHSRYIQYLYKSRQRRFSNSTTAGSRYYVSVISTTFIFPLACPVSARSLHVFMVAISGPSEIVKLHYVLNVYHYNWILIINLVFILNTNLLYYCILFLVGVPTHLAEIQRYSTFELCSFELIQHYINVHKNILEFKEILYECI